MDKNFMNALLKSVIDQDEAPVVICDLNHTMVYFNPAAVENYKKWGGAELIGKSIFSCHNGNSQDIIKRVVAWFAESKDNNKVFTSYNDKKNKDVYMIALRDEDGNLIGYYEKHEFRNKDTNPFYDMK